MNIISEIKKMDRKSEEFAKLFEVVNEMYFTFDNPDSFQQAALVLNMVLHRGEEWMVQALAEMANQMFQCVDQNVKATHGSFELRDKQYFFDLYQDKEALGAVHKMFRNAVLMKTAPRSGQMEEK